MTTRPMAAEWDDGRLAAAFALRAERTPATPPDLAVAVRARLEVAPGRPLLSVRRLAPGLGLAAAVVVAIAVGAGQLTRSQPGASSSAGALDPSSLLPSPMSVREAMAVRDGGVDDREIAVTGFLASYGFLGCPADLGPRNPTRLGCPAFATWLLDAPEVLETRSGNTTTGHPPSGPSIQPSFDVAGFPDLRGAPDHAGLTLVGHFDDRRALLCEPAQRDGCAATFVVDRVAAVDGIGQPVTTILRTERWDEATQAYVTEHPRDLEADVDRLVLGAVPDGSILSRQLVTIDQVIGIEPILATDDFVPFVGNPATLVWLVTALDASDRAPKARTFALFDGSNWFAEVTAEGARMRERRATVGPADGAPPSAPSGDPRAFDSAPTSVLGITVRDIATIERDRRAAMDDLGRDEFAIRAWYVGPDPGARCDPVASLHAPTPPCDEARHWLLDRPEQFGVEVGQLRTNPEHWPAALNPILPIDVPFDVPPSWAGDVPIPQPVIVFGHFEDHRVDTYAGNVYFVIDALAWSPGRDASTLDTLTRLTSAATEDPGAVLTRIESASSHEAMATWTTVVDAADVASLEANIAVDAPEFAKGAPVWMVRRLIRNEIDGRPRLAIEWAYTSDQGHLIWLTETPDSPPDLAPTLILRDPSPRTRSVRVFDYDSQVVAIRSTAGLDLAWRRIEPRERGLEVARGASDREVAIRWTAGRCDPDWRVELRSAVDGSGSVGVEVWTSGEYCPDDPVARSIVLEFGHPIAPGDFTTTWNPSGG